MEYTSFYLSFVYVHSTFSANKEKSMDTKQKSGQKLVSWLQQPLISHTMALKYVKFMRF